MLGLFHLDNRFKKRWRNLADQCKQRLTEQQITLEAPGTILKDVNILLDFIGADGIASRGRNVTLPCDVLPELNAKISHPIELALKRPLLRDYPNLAGIFILLRVADLLQKEGNRAVVSPAALKNWRGMNFTEQYFALLEALLFQAQTSVLDGKRTSEEAVAFETIAVFLGQLNDQWRNFDYYESARSLSDLGVTK